MASCHNAKTWGWLLGVLATVCASAASADDRAVVQRLKNYGGMSEPDARSVIDKISQRMRVAADMSHADDPLRVAISNALYESAAPPDPAATSMVRLRLYAGLTEWALDQVFSSRRAVTQVCSGGGLDAADCRAVLAAGQSVPLEDISPLRLSTQTTPQTAKREAAPAAAAPQPVALAATVRWPRHNDEVAAPAPAARSSAPTIAAADPAPVARTKTIVANKPSAAEVAERKADYAAQRQAYLERRRQEMEARRAKIIATAGGERVQRGPATQEEAEVAGLSHSAGKSPHASAAMVASSSSATPAAKRPTREKASDSDLFDSLLENPLGKQ